MTLERGHDMLESAACEYASPMKSLLARLLRWRAQRKADRTAARLELGDERRAREETGQERNDFNEDIGGGSYPTGR
jgi:hypothetical protein